jgi:excisionase family DNA binding protein
MDSLHNKITLWKVSEAAAFLNISCGTLYHWVSQRRVPCIRFGSRCLRFDPEKTNQWAAEHLNSPASHDTYNHICSNANGRSEEVK